MHYPIRPILVAPDLNHGLQLKKRGINVDKLINCYSENPYAIVSITLSSDKKRIVSIRKLGSCKSQVEYDVLSCEFIDKMKAVFDIVTPRERVERNRARWDWLFKKGN